VSTQAPVIFFCCFGSSAAEAPPLPSRPTRPQAHHPQAKSLSLPYGPSRSPHVFPVGAGSCRRPPCPPPHPRPPATPAAGGNPRPSEPVLSGAEGPICGLDHCRPPPPFPPTLASSPLRLLASPPFPPTLASSPPRLPASSTPRLFASPPPRRSGRKESTQNSPSVPLDAPLRLSPAPHFAPERFP